MTRSLVKDDGSSTQSVFDTGTKPWSSDTSAFDIYQRLQSQRVDFDNGSQQIKKYDPDNNHPYKELDITKGSDGQISAAQLQLEQNIIAAGGSVGQIFGSALGRALAPNNQFAQLAVGTVAGLIGQKLLQTFTASLTLDASRFVASNFATVTGLDVAHAGIGAISSFLTAELGRELHLTGFGAELFNGAVGGVTGSVLNQVVDKIVIEHLSFDAAIGAINWGTAATQAGYNISSAAGSFLAHAMVPAESHEGAVGGQLLGAVGSALGLSAVLNAAITGFMGFLIPGLGSFFGTIIGTMLGDAIAGDPAYPKATHDIEILGSDYHFQNRLVGTDDHGNAAVSKEMGDQVTAIANSYLDAVHGAGIYYSGKVMIGYNAGAAPYQYVTGWFPNGTEITPHFANATDAIQEGVRELLVNTEVIGGDLLMKRAHQAFMNGPHPVPNETSPDFSDLISLSGDLSVAQDYENYLNNREAINALIATNPNTAFAAGWIATFARVNDLGLNQVHGSDFTGGLAGWLDSVSKAGLGAEAANVTVRRGSDNSVIVEIKVANGVEVPGSLAVFADQMSVTSDASGQTLHFTVDSGVVANGFHFLGLTASGGDGTNDLWTGSANAEHTYVGTGGHDILVGGTMNDVIYGGAGWDFIDGGAGNDYLFGQDGNDILRGGPNTDFLFGGAGDDTYVFNRGDGVDTVLDDVTFTTDTSHWHDWYEDQGGTNILHHDWVPETTTNHPDAGKDSLLFGPGIARSDIILVQSGNDLIVYVKDPAHPGAALTDNITLQRWFNDPNDRIEKFVFADGATLDLSNGVLAPYLVPFGASLSHTSVVEKSAVGTVVGTVAGFDFAGANLSYSLDNDAGGRFAINASTGVVTVAGAIDYDAGQSWQIAVRISDGTHVAGQAFTINVIDIPNRAPVLSVPASTVKADPGQPLQVASLFGASDADNDALTYYFQDNTTAANSGHFVLNGVALAQGASFGVSAAQLASLSFVAGADGVTDDIGMQLSDSHSAVSAVGVLHVKVNHAPVLSVPAATITATTVQPLQVASWFSATDADNDALTYYIQDGNAANSGHFVLNGTAYANGANVSVSAAQLASLTYVPGTGTGAAEDIWIQTSDGHAASALGQVHVDHAPVLTVPAATIKADPGQSLQVASLFSATDADNDALTYYFQDNTTAANSGHFVLNGIALAQGASFGVNAAQLASLSFVAGAEGVTDDIGMQLSDGYAVSAVGVLHVNVNHAPVLSVPASTITANAGQSLQMSGLFSATDADSDALTYYFQDGTAAASSGHFVLNGAALAQGASFGVTAAQLASLSFVAGAEGSPDDIGMQLSDGHAVSAVGALHVNVNHAPVLSVPASTIKADPGQSLQMSGLFSATDADNDTLTYYFQDENTAANSGHFVLNGAALAQGAGFGVSVAQLASLSFVAGADGVADDIGMQLADGHGALSAVGVLHVNVNHAPVLTVPVSTITANAGQSLQMSSLFSATDADNDALTYYFLDATTAANSGHFVLNGTALAQGAGFGVSAAQLASLSFVAGADGVTDDVGMQLSDGHAVSAGAALHIEGWHL